MNVLYIVECRGTARRRDRAVPCSDNRVREDRCAVLNHVSAAEIRHREQRHNARDCQRDRLFFVQPFLIGHFVSPLVSLKAFRTPDPRTRSAGSGPIRIKARQPKLTTAWLAVNERLSDEARLDLAVACIGFWRGPDKRC